MQSSRASPELHAARRQRPPSAAHAWRDGSFAARPTHRLAHRPRMMAIGVKHLAPPRSLPRSPCLSVRGLEGGLRRGRGRAALPETIVAVAHGGTTRDERPESTNAEVLSYGLPMAMGSRVGIPYFMGARPCASNLMRQSSPSVTVSCARVSYRAIVSGERKLALARGPPPLRGRRRRPQPNRPHVRRLAPSPLPLSRSSRADARRSTRGCRIFAP